MSAAILGGGALSILAAAGCGGDPELHPFFREGRRPLVFAHRGGGGTEPEATLPTMLAAHMRSPDVVIEFDVHRTKDGHLVVIHDATVDRTTEASGRVQDKTLAELKALDAGFCATPNRDVGTASEGQCHGIDDAARFPFRGKGFRIPTLDEVLQGLPADARISLEVKQAGIEREVADRMRASGRLARLIMGAEFDSMSVRLRELLPEVPHYLPTGAAKCLALTTKLGLGYPACPFYEAFASPIEGAGLALDTRGVIDAAHDRGIAVIYWTINDRAEMERLFRLGADGIFTDYPDTAREVLAALRRDGVVR